MSRPTDEDPPPDSRDLEAWRQAVNEGRYTQYRLETVVAAIQDLGPCTDKAVLNPLAKHLSDVLLRILHKPALSQKALTPSRQLEQGATEGA